MHTEDRLFTSTEAAEIEMLKTSKNSLYRKAKKLPLAVWLSQRQLRFSWLGIQRYIEEKQHARTGV